MLRIVISTVHQVLLAMASTLIAIAGRFPGKLLENFFPVRVIAGAKQTENVRYKTHFSRHCEKPTTEPVRGEIQGELPSWLEGTMIRNGPGIQKIGPDEYKHIFDGLAILHRYHIENGEVTYTSRPLGSDTYKKNMEANRIVVGEFGTTSFRDPCKTLFQRLQATFSALTGKTTMTDNCSVNVGYYGDQLYAMTETCYIRRVDPENLKTIGEKTNLTKYVAVNHATAHPHILPDGSVLNLGSNYRHKQGPRYCIVKIPPTFGQEESPVTNGKVVAEIPFSSSRKPSYYHSFGMSKDKIIFIESPLRLDLLKLIAGAALSISFSESMSWDANLKTKFHVASLEDGQIQPIDYEADAFFTFHHINAFEEDDQLVVDVAAYKNGGMVGSLKHYAEDTLREDFRPYPRRYVLPLKIPEGAQVGTNLVTMNGTSAKAILTKLGKNSRPTIYLEPEYLTDSTVELPRINYSYNGGEYNFFYGICVDGNTEDLNILEPDSISKTNIKTKEVTRWHEQGKSPSEPIFVPNPHGKAEDDGVLLTALSHREEPNAVTLLVLDAKSMKEVARVQFATAGAFTTTFHGQWAGENEKIHLY